MSRLQLVRNSPDLTRLVNEGYTVRIKGGHLLIDDVPFVTSDRVVATGTLACPLDLQGEVTRKPGTHIMWFIGGVPCDTDGRELPLLVHQRGPLKLTEDITADCSFSQKPSPAGYDDYYQKVVTYLGLIIGHAQALRPGATAITFRPVQTDEAEGVFKYYDTASSRAGITAHTDKLAIGRVAIVGLGGTGAYLLDLLAKVPVSEIHLYDGDVFATHNAFRAPGATSIGELTAAPYKVDYHAGRYEPLRWGIQPHRTYVTADNVDELLTMDFVFLAMDANEKKKLIVDRLTESQVSFIDTGIGVVSAETGLAGLVRITTSLPGQREHIEDAKLISYVIGDGDEYETNIQVAELNALAATLAVIAFKKKYGFYRDEARELHSLYRIDSNELLNRFGDDDTCAKAGEGGCGAKS
jgi:hypothetical protein